MKRVLVWFASALLTLSASLSSFAIGLIIIDDQAANESPRVEPGSRPAPGVPRPIHRFTPLEVRSVRITGSIKGQVAHTRIEEEFYNSSPRRLEGTFLLPLPKGAHLEKFLLEINGRMTEAELLGADKARGIYEEIVRKAKDPALLEYIGRDLLKVRIFPIEPNSAKKIELSYDQVLPSDSGLVDYSLPLNAAQYSAGAIGKLEVSLSLDSATDLKTIYSPSHAIDVARKSDKAATITFQEANARPDRDFQLFYSAQPNELGLSFLSYKKENEDGYFMLLLSPGVDQTRQKVLPKDVVFVLDTSGSMAGKKLAQAKKALTFCINALNSDDRFEIIRFSSETESLFKKLTPVSDDTRREAETFVENLKTLGGTAINDALRQALAVRPTDGARPFQVVFLTDGLPTVGETSENGILRTVTDKNQASTRIFCFGIGTDVNTHLLDRIAEETAAVAQYVLPDEDLEVKVSSFFSKISDPVLAGVNLDFGKIRITKMHPGKLPDLYQGQQLMVLGRYSGSGSTKARLTGKAGERQLTFDYPLNFPAAGEEHPFIPRLWASRRVGYLLDETRLHGENAELKDEITQLAREYGIVTPYTSFLVQEDQPLAVAASAPATPVDALSFYRRNPGLLNRYTPSERLSEESLQRAKNLYAPEARSGDTAVAVSRLGGALKSATTEQQVATAGRELKRYAATGQLLAAPTEPSRNELPTRIVAARTFQLQNGIWTDTALSNLKDQAATQKIRFDTPEYWAFAAAHPDLREILALGTSVKFIHQGQAYEITSATP